MQEHHLQVFLARSLNGNFNQDYSNSLWLKVYYFKYTSQYFQQVQPCYVFFILEQKDKVYLH